MGGWVWCNDAVPETAKPEWSVEAVEPFGWPLLVTDPGATEHARQVVARVQIREHPLGNSLGGRVSLASGVAPVLGAYGSGSRESP